VLCKKKTGIPVFKLGLQQDLRLRQRAGECQECQDHPHLVVFLRGKLGPSKKQMADLGVYLITV
jgi:hypothetical protein